MKTSVLSPLTYLRRNLGRTLPMMFVIVLAITLVASVVSIVRSIDLTVFTLYGYNRYLTGLTPRNALAIDDAELAKIRALPETGNLYPTHSYVTQIKTTFGKMVFPIFGMEPAGRREIMERCNITVIAGRMPEEGRPEAIISADVAHNLNLKIGDIISRPDAEDSYAPVPIKLVGMFGGKIWLGLTSKSFVDAHSPFTWQGCLVFAKTPQQQRALDRGVDRVVDKSRTRAWTFAVLVRETQSALSNLYLILDVVVTIIVAVISFVCGLLSNIYYTQRLPEIATLSAIGYPRSRLLRRAVGETALLCAFGWLFGCAVTIGLLALVRALLLAPRGLLLDPTDATAYLFTLPLPITITLFAVVTISLRLSSLDPVSIIERRG